MRGRYGQDAENAVNMSKGNGQAVTPEEKLAKTRAYDKAKYAANPEPKRARARAHYAANREQKLKYAKTYRASHPDRHKAYRAANLEKVRERCRLWSTANAQYRKEYTKTFDAINPGHRRAVRHKWLGYPEPTRRCPNNCECCGKTRDDLKHALHLDHCHKTGAFRGWLCRACNLGIGNLDDSIEGVRMALAYLEKCK